MYTYSSNSNWRDQLTAFNGETITYDASGNPTSYYNGTRWTMEWEQGRNLVSATGGGQVITYRYDHTGLRTMKAVTGTPHYYTYASGKLLRETYDSTTLDFVYDHLGWPYAMRYNGTWYYYILNAQGDVVYMVDGSGNQVAYYNYDPFGKIIAIEGSIAHINPLRYRGYYYDTETGFYYLQNRYYDPAICRFINADAMVYTGQGMLGCNMYAYCRNNPTSKVDITGTADVDCLDAETKVEIVDDDDLGTPSFGGSAWASFTATMKAAANGLSMASGVKTGTQNHHFLSNKNSIYTSQYKSITEKYGLSLNDPWNKRYVENHSGRHTNAYHEFMLQMLYGIDSAAQGNQASFLEGFQILSDFVSANPWILYAQ